VGFLPVLNLAFKQPGISPNSVEILPPQPKNSALSNAYAPPSGAAFAFLTPVEALWKQEGKKSLAIKRIAGTIRKLDVAPNFYPA
jgi:hypothetical protein